MEQFFSAIIAKMTAEFAVVLLLWFSVLFHILLAPIVYFKITRKLDKIDPNLKYSIVAIMPPLLQQNYRGMKCGMYIIANSRKYHDVLQRGKVVGQLHFRKYCSKFDVLLSYLHVFSLVLFGILAIIFGIFYME